MTDPELELLIIRLREELPGDVYDRVHAFLQAGTELLNGGEPHHARRVFEAILDDVKDQPHSYRRDQALVVAWYNIACVERHAGNAVEELGIYERLLERFGNERDPYVRYIVAMASVNRGVKLAEVGKLEEAEGAYAEIVARFSDAPEPETRAQVATAIVYRGVTHGLRGHVEDELRDDDLAIALFGGDADPILRGPMAKAFYSKAMAAIRLGRHGDALRDIDELKKRFGDDGDPEIRLLIANAEESQRQLADALMTVEENQIRLAQLIVGEDFDAVAALAGVILARCSDPADAVFGPLVVAAMLAKAMVLARQKRFRECFEWCERLLASGTAEEEMRVDAARMAFEAIVQLRELGEYREALAACDRYTQIADAPLSRARMLLNKGVLLRDLGRMHEAVQACDDLIMAGADPALRSVVAIALRNKGNFLEEMAWPEAAADVYAELLARFAADEEPEILDQVTVARERLALLRAP